MKRTILALTLLLLCVLIPIVSNVQPAQAFMLVIDSEGYLAVTENIKQEGNVYTLTGNINRGIRIEKSNVIIDGSGYAMEGNELEGNRVGILVLPPGVNNVEIRNLSIRNFSTGISLRSSSGNIVAGCNISDCFTGIDLSGGSNNVILGNILVKNGIQLGYSSNNIFRDNRLEKSTFGFGTTEGYVNDVDSSNTIDGKPIYYLVNKRDLIVSPPDYCQEVGYLALVNCSGITVKNLILSGLGVGISLVHTTNSTLIHNNLTYCWHGLQILKSYGNLITENNVVGNEEYGIIIQSMDANTIVRNKIENNEYGIAFGGSANQIIYNNNFINNSMHVDSSDWSPLNFMLPPFGEHVWDNGYSSGGNYWDDYNGTDANHDGIGDTPYLINQIRNNTDFYPLMKPVDVIIEFPSYTPTPVPTITPYQGDQQTRQDMTAGAVLAVTSIAIFLGLLFYFIKRR